MNKVNITLIHQR